MPLDNLSLAYQLLELNPLLEDSYVNKVSELKKGFVKVKLHTKSGSKDLILAPNDLFISSFSLQARHGKSNLARALKKELYNKKIKEVIQHEFDRVVEIVFFEHSLILEFFGEGNKILLDSKREILSCEKNEKWADRTIKKGETYSFPKVRGLNPSKLSKTALKEAFSSSKKDSVRTLIANVNIAPKIAEEVFYELKIDKNSEVSSLSDKNIEAIAKSVKEFYSIKKSKLKPVSSEKTAYPFLLKHLKGEKIDSINSFIDESHSSMFAKVGVEKEEKAHKENLSRLEFHAKQQDTAREKFKKQASENQLKADLIYQNYNEIEELKKAILIAMKKDLKEKEIMYKFSSVAESNKVAKMVKGIDLAKKKFTIEL